MQLSFCIFRDGELPFQTKSHLLIVGSQSAFQYEVDMKKHVAALGLILSSAGAFAEGCYMLDTVLAFDNFVIKRSFSDTYEVIDGTVFNTFNANINGGRYIFVKKGFNRFECFRQ